MGKQSQQEQLQLAAKAAQGNRAERAQVNAIVDPLIRFQTDRFCKRFCRENHYRYRCTLVPPWGGAPADAALCEWGNASYAWMLDDLTGEKRLMTYQGRNDASLFDYLYQIANSRPFYERWKDWRFGRRVHVPEYIQQLGPHAAAVFLGLRAHDELENIAQQRGLSLQQVKDMVQQIMILLTQKKRLHLLNPPRSLSLDDEGDDNGLPQQQLHQVLASHDEGAEAIEQKQRMAAAWQQLSSTEQFVLEALVIEDQDANHVLEALKKLGLSLKNGVAPEDTDRQQLYYFRRKTLARLAQLMEDRSA